MKRNTAVRKNPAASERARPVRATKTAARQAADAQGDTTGSCPGENTAPDMPATARELDQTDIERVDEHKGGSIETCSTDHSADSVGVRDNRPSELI